MHLWFFCIKAKQRHVEFICMNLFVYLLLYIKSWFSVWKVLCCCGAASGEPGWAGMDHVFVAREVVSECCSVDVYLAATGGCEQGASQGIGCWDNWFTVSLLVLCCFCNVCIARKLMLAMFCGVHLVSVSVHLETTRTPSHHVDEDYPAGPGII